VFKGKKSGKNLEIYEDKEGVIRIRNLKKHEIMDIRDLYGLFKSGVICHFPFSITIIV
jgi:hypothetical protein